MKFGERRKVFCKGKIMSKALWQEGAWDIQGPPKPGTGAQPNQRERGTRLAEGLAGAHGEAAAEGLRAGAGALASRAPDGEGMGGNVIKGVETRSCVL